MRKRAEQVICQWFALCQNAATLTRDAGPLGEVPICERCNAKMDRIEALSNERKAGSDA